MKEGSEAEALRNGLAYKFRLNGDEVTFSIAIYMCFIIIHIVNQ